MSRIQEFAGIYRLYRAGGNTRRYALWTAWQIAVKRTPF